MDLNGLLRRAVELGASDIHLKIGQPPILRRDGDLGAMEGFPALEDPNLEAILQIGRTLGLCTVAEGIEHPAQQERLLELGCERGQGYYFAAPAPADEVAGFLRAYDTA